MAVKVIAHQLKKTTKRHSKNAQLKNAYQLEKHSESDSSATVPQCRYHDCFVDIPILIEFERLLKLYRYYNRLSLMCTVIYR